MRKEGCSAVLGEHGEKQQGAWCSFAGTLSAGSGGWYVEELQEGK